MEDSLRYWIWVRRHTRPASAAGRLLLERYSSPEEIYALDAVELKKIKGLTKEDVKELSLKDLEASDPILAYCEKQKIRILSQRTIRARLMLFLQIRAKRAKSNEFEIPFDRQALADYLCVDRSALSAELSKLRKERLVESVKNKFKLLAS